eukprot:7115005-Pyramimonas_sp.AAC.1
MAGTVTNSTVSLGTDLAPGQRRSTKNAFHSRKVRFRCMYKRHKVLQRYRRSLPRQKGRIGKIYVAGLQPAATFGSAVVGMSDHELHQARRVMLSYRVLRHR